MLVSHCPVNVQPWSVITQCSVNAGQSLSSQCPAVVSDDAVVSECWSVIVQPWSVMTQWSVNAGQSLSSQCPAGAPSRFADGLTKRSSKCVLGIQPRMTVPVTDCQGMSWQYLVTFCRKLRRSMQNRPRVSSRSNFYAV